MSISNTCHQRPQFGVGCENAVEANQVQLGSGHRRSQSLREFQRRHHQVGGAVSDGVAAVGPEQRRDLGRAIAAELTGCVPGLGQKVGMEHDDRGQPQTLG